ncbi:MAG: 2-(3-amino-3-carboxypropyl)histidine synthase [Candidatus Methanomethylophilaceae archaeon]|nr:2-(3-amino-3-carboxypropyl)histidine synthase [Candidatus Methanomethylophilaceae archaeon]
MFDLELERTISWIKSNGYSRVAVQLPEGLKLRSSDISDALSSAGAEVIIIGRPCYGACDYYSDYKKIADALVHYGHSAMPSLGNDQDVLYIEARADCSIAGPLKESVGKLPQNVGVLASVQYIGLIHEAVKIIESSGRKAFVSGGDKRIMYPGQVLGCDCSAAEAVSQSVDGFLFLGEGDFHPLAAAFGTEKTLFVLNPVTGEMRNIDSIKDRILRKRFAAITLASEANSFMIIICGKVGQNRSSEAEMIARKIRDAGKKAYVMLLDEINPETLAHYRVDAFVNTACPRIAMDESARFNKPILTIPETEIALGLRDWEDYEFDAIRN